MGRFSAFIFKILALPVCLAFLSSCKENLSDSPAPEFSEWIKAYTGGVLRTGSSVKILLSSSSDWHYLENMSQDSLNSLFSFSPALSGQVRAVQNSIVEFIPDEGALEPGRKYNAVFNLGDIARVSERFLEKFRFSFVTEHKKAVLAVAGVRITSGTPEKAEVSGTVSFSGHVKLEDAEKMISFKWPGKGASVVFDRGENPENLHFTVRDISLREDPLHLQLNFDGRKYGFPDLQSETVKIPSKAGFKVLGAVHHDGKSPYVEVRFTKPLDDSSDPEGLFELSGAGRSYISLSDNIAKIYYEPTGSGELSLEVMPGVSSFDGQKLADRFSAKFGETSIKPAVRIELDGNIVPDAEKCILPVSAVNLSAFDISVIRIYEDNILSFLQDNDMENDSQLRRFGRMVYKKTVRLDNDPSLNLHRWQRFGLDISGLIRQAPGAIYRIRIAFKKEYSLYGRDSGNGLSGNSGIFSGSGGMIMLTHNDMTPEDEAVWDEPVPYYYESYYDWDEYDWNESDNPEHPSYYMEAGRFPVCNITVSDIGLTVKYSENGTVWSVVNDILTSDPVAGAEVTVYNYQLQEIGKKKTGRNGVAEIEVTGKPFVLAARRGSSSAFLKMTDGKENPVSRFDVGGRKTEKGLKAYIYGERGVWRPGDTLHVTFIADDRCNVLPDNHPVIMELYAPQGQFYTKVVNSKSVGGFYSFHIPTSPDDPTGTWNAWFKIGGSSFHKALMIETIKPNRLKMKLDTGGDMLQGGETAHFGLKAEWLSGPVASGLKSSVEMTLGSAGKSFKGYDGFVFTDPAGSDLKGVSSVLFEKDLDSRGQLREDVSLPEYKGAPGMMRANLVTHIEEPGGDESITSTSVLYSPYKAYVGISEPENPDFMETDKTHVFKTVVLDRNGKPLEGRRLEYRIYKMDWSWWWENDPEKIRSYVNSTAAKIHSSGKIVSGLSPVDIPFRVDYPEWGRYLVYVRDIEGGHSAGLTVLADWPSYMGRSRKTDPAAVTILSFSTDKKEYVPGEKATVFIPAAKDAQALVSLENGSKVISTEWVRTSESADTPYTFTVTEEMSPNFYVHVTLLQKYGNTSNDLPVRMYGVVPVMVRNEASHLYPQIRMPDMVRPLEDFNIKVSEKNGRKMSYTLAIVDEGLLDLTAFRTPDPWTAMNEREALGVKTWDIYDNVAGAGAGEFSAMLSIGGDRTIDRNARQDNRFNPIVRYLGPYTFTGKENVHRVRLPMYAGSVRVMLVAGNGGAYGNAEKTVPVRSPLMVLPTLPPAVGPGEKVTLPVNVFAMEDGVDEVSVSVIVKGAAKTVSGASQKISFAGKGDKLVKYVLEALDEEGVAEVTVSASGGGYKAEETLYLPVRNPNLPSTVSQYAVIESGKSAEFDYTPFEKQGKSGVSLSLSGFPTFDIDGCFNYMAGYQYNCTEQIAARGIALLSLRPLLDKEQSLKADKLIPELLSSLYARQLPDGGFAYWPGNTSAEEWVTSMAGQFIQTAAVSGYTVNKGVFSAWLNFQKRCVRNYRSSAGSEYYSLVQAYRLYTLALASSPETGAMNRLKEDSGIGTQASWRLAAAYAVAGKKNVASDMIASLATGAVEHQDSGMMYATPLRDKAMILETMVLSGDIRGAVRLASDVAGELSSGCGMTTQTVAFSAVALGRLAEKINTGIIEARVLQKPVTAGEGRRKEVSEDVKSVGPVYENELDPAYGKVSVENKSDGHLYAVLSVTRTEPFGKPVPARSSGLELAVSWTDLNGNPVDPSRLVQGTDFMATVRVINRSAAKDYGNLALDFPVASGWEIFNERVFAAESGVSDSPYEYKDIRDGRVIYYFSLPAGTVRAYRVRLRAAYEGEFVLPSAECSDMYDPSVFAGTGVGGKVVVYE